MNNNYHTQLNQNPHNNILNDIAANHSLQQNIVGTPIKKSSNELNRMQQQQKFVQMNLPNNYENPNYYTNNPQNGDEIELTDNGNNNGVDTVNQDMEAAHINQRLQEMKQNEQQHQQQQQQQQQHQIPQIPNYLQKNYNTHQNYIPQQNLKSNLKPYPKDLMVHQNNNAVISTEKKPLSSNNFIEYIAIPLLLIILFILLVHPISSNVSKYIAPINSTKGMVTRGAILAIAYIVIRFVATNIENKKN